MTTYVAAIYAPVDPRDDWHGSLWRIDATAPDGLVDVFDAKAGTLEVVEQTVFADEGEARSWAEGLVRSGRASRWVGPKGGFEP